VSLWVKLLLGLDLYSYNAKIKCHPMTITLVNSRYAKIGLYSIQLHFPICESKLERVSTSSRQFDNRAIISIRNWYRSWFLQCPNQVQPYDAYTCWMLHHNMLKRVCIQFNSISLSVKVNSGESSSQVDNLTTML